MNWGVAPGFLRLFVSILRIRAGSARAAAGTTRQGLTLGRSAAPTALRCSSWVRAAQLATFATLTALGQVRRISLRSALCAPTPDLRFSSPQKSPLPGSACREAPEVVFDAGPATIASRPEGGTAPGRVCAAEERRARGRARSALRELTRRICPSAVSEVNAASCATGRETEHRRAPSRSEGQQSESRRRTALGPAPLDAGTTRKQIWVESGAPIAVRARFVRRGSSGGATEMTPSSSLRSRPPRSVQAASSGPALA